MNQVIVKRTALHVPRCGKLRYVNLLLLSELNPLRWAFIRDMREKNEVFTV